MTEPKNGRPPKLCEAMRRHVLEQVGCCTRRGERKRCFLLLAEKWGVSLSTLERAAQA